MSATQAHTPYIVGGYPHIVGLRGRGGVPQIGAPPTKRAVGDNMVPAQGHDDDLLPITEFVFNTFKRKLFMLGFQRHQEVGFHIRLIGSFAKVEEMPFLLRLRQRFAQGAGSITIAIAIAIAYAYAYAYVLQKLG